MLDRILRFVFLNQLCVVYSTAALFSYTSTIVNPFLEKVNSNALKSKLNSVWEIKRYIFRVIQKLAYQRLQKTVN